MAFKLFVYLVCQAQAGIVHCQQEAFDFQLRVQPAFYYSYGVQKFGDAFQREIFGLYGNNHRIGGCERIHRYKPQRRRAVDDDVVVLVFHRSEHVQQHPLALVFVYQLYFRSGKVDAGSYQEKAVHACGHFGALQRVFVYEAFVDGGIHGAWVDAVAGSGIGLRVGIDNKHFAAFRGQRCGQINGCSGFAYSAFLVCYCYYFSH